jgi:hypothetical protein
MQSKHNKIQDQITTHTIYIYKAPIQNATKRPQTSQTHTIMPNEDTYRADGKTCHPHQTSMQNIAMEEERGPEGQRRSAGARSHLLPLRVGFQRRPEGEGEG